MYCHAEDDLLHYVDYFPFREAPFFFLHLVVEGASVAELNHHDFEVLVLVHVVAFHHMSGVAPHHHF